MYSSRCGLSSGVHTVPADSAVPDFLHGVLFKEDIAPDVMFYIQPATGNGEEDVRMQV